MPFGASADAKKIADLYAKIDKLLLGNGFRAEKLQSCAAIACHALAEKQIVDASISMGDGARTVYINEPCNLSVSLGGRDLISIQSVMSGRAVTEAKNSAAVAEQMLDGEITFAYSERIGYLCQNPELCGSCFELSAALFLPSLRLLGIFDEVRRQLLSRGAVLSPMFHHRELAGDLYVLSYVPPYLVCEESATLHFDAIVGELAAREEKNERMLFPDAEDKLSDCAMRAMGILKYATKMSESEMLCLLSDVRLAASLCSDRSIPLPSMTDLNFLSVEGLSCSLMSGSAQKCATAEELDAARAAFLKKYISAKVKTAV